MLPLFYMLRKSFVLSILLIAGSCNAQEQLYYQVRADVYSEPLSIKSFTDDWSDPNFKSGKNAFAHGLMQLGVKQGAWDLSWIWRYDYLLRFSKDTAKLYYQIKNEKPIDANTQELDKIFAETNELRQSIQDKKLKNVPCDQLSMGMSRDYDIAIQNGSTFVRIGSAFFKENGE